MVEKLPYLAHEHHYAIAAVATRAAQLDSQIEFEIWSLFAFMGMDSTAEFILKNMNGDRYVGLLKDMLIDRLPARSEEIAAAFTEIGRLRRERNEILHWLYGKSEKDDLARSMSIRPFRESQERHRTALDIQAVADGMLHYVGILYRWGDEVRTIHLAWLRTRGPQALPANSAAGKTDLLAEALLQRAPRQGTSEE